MPDLFYPQLDTGVIAQYPLRRTDVRRTVLNAMADGTLVSYLDSDASQLQWELTYQGLSEAELQPLLNFFTACAGRHRGFTFLDPTGNLLVQSANLGATAWQASGLIQTAGNTVGPDGTASAFTMTNSGQVRQAVMQTLRVPASYRYTLSMYVRSLDLSNVGLIAQTPSDQVQTRNAIGPEWVRVALSPKLNDPGFSLAVGFELDPGQRVEIFGPQLEPQLAPSPYKPTYTEGGIYSNAHWGSDEFPVSLDGPNLYSTVVTIEARR